MDAASAGGVRRGSALLRAVAACLARSRRRQRPIFRDRRATQVSPCPMFPNRRCTLILQLFHGADGAAKRAAGSYRTIRAVLPQSLLLERKAFKYMMIRARRWRRV